MTTFTASNGHTVELRADTDTLAIDDGAGNVFALMGGRIAALREFFQQEEHMTDRIDHAAQARKIMLEVNTDERGVVPLELLDPEERWIYDATMREAQVHATLALVEQQRIANLIALAHVADTSDAAVSPLEQTAWEAIGITGSGEMRPEIREVLGIS